MKNIHILPIDKPSRLCFRNYYFINKDNIGEYSNVEFKNIYITSDEEIKEGDKFLHFWYKDEFSNLDKTKIIISSADINTNSKRHRSSYLGKIILTTDQDLIKDGVQAIDNKFLEWFVKNPSCEKVEVKDSSIVKEHIWDGSNDGEIIWEKEIIIPKEEPKQKYESECICDTECRGFTNVKCKKPKQKVICTNDICQGECGECNFMTTINVGKQEKLEEASWKFNPLKKLDGEFLRHAFKEGAKWQQEQIKKMYSEKELLEFGELVLDTFHSEGRTKSGKDRLARIKFKGWFEQFKKK